MDIEPGLQKYEIEGGTVPPSISIIKLEVGSKFCKKLEVGSQIYKKLEVGSQLCKKLEVASQLFKKLEVRGHKYGSWKSLKLESRNFAKYAKFWLAPVSCSDVPLG